MGTVPGYILSVVCTAVLCGMIGLLFDKKSATSGVVQLILGIVMTVVVIKPIVQGDMFSFGDYFDNLNESGAYIASAGSEYAKRNQAERIKEQTEAYILNKAEDIGMDITAEVSLNEDNIPVAVDLNGNVSPYMKVQMTNYLRTQLAIQEECIIWN